MTKQDQEWVKTMKQSSVKEIFVENDKTRAFEKYGIDSCTTGSSFIKLSTCNLDS